MLKRALLARRQTRVTGSGRSHFLFSEEIGRPRRPAQGLLLRFSTSMRCTSQASGTSSSSSSRSLSSLVPMVRTEDNHESSSSLSSVVVPVEEHSRKNSSIDNASDAERFDVMKGLFQTLKAGLTPPRRLYQGLSSSSPTSSTPVTRFSGELPTKHQAMVSPWNSAATAAAASVSSVTASLTTASAMPQPWTDTTTHHEESMEDILNMTSQAIVPQPMEPGRVSDGWENEAASLVVPESRVKDPASRHEKQQRKQKATGPEGMMMTPEQERAVRALEGTMMSLRKPGIALRMFRGAMECGAGPFLPPQLVAKLFDMHRHHPLHAYEILQCYRALPSAQPRFIVKFYAQTCHAIGNVDDSGMLQEPKEYKSRNYNGPRRRSAVGNGNIAGTEIPQQRLLEMTRQLIHDVLHHQRSVVDMDDYIYQQFRDKVIPTLLIGLVSQSNASIGDGARVLWNECPPDRRFVLHADHKRALLKFCRRTRYGELPYHQILYELVVKEDEEVIPAACVNTLQCQFPFLDLRAVSMTLDAMLYLNDKTRPRTRAQDSTADDAEGIDTSSMTTAAMRQTTNDAGNKPLWFFPDMGTLEHIAFAAARAHNYEVCLKVWDVVEAMGERSRVMNDRAVHFHKIVPSQSLYESVLTAFLSGREKQDENAVAVLCEMETQAGFTPLSRGIIRTLSASISRSIPRVDKFFFELMSGEVEGSVVTTSSLNIVMAACAQLGDVHRTFSVLDDMEAQDLIPNQDSYSFAMEALATRAHLWNVEVARDRNADVEWKESLPDRLAQLLQKAELLLDIMEQAGEPIGHDVFHEYICLLCNAGSVDDATQACQDALGTGIVEPQIHNKTLHKVMVANGLDGGTKNLRYEEPGMLQTVQHFASSMTEKWDHVAFKLSKWRGRQALREKRNPAKDAKKASSEQEQQEREDPTQSANGQEEEGRNNESSFQEELSLHELLSAEDESDEEERMNR